MVWDKADFSPTPDETEGLITVLQIISDKARAVSDALESGKEARA